METESEDMFDISGLQLDLLTMSTLKKLWNAITGESDDSEDKQEVQREKRGEEEESTFTAYNRLPSKHASLSSLPFAISSTFLVKLRNIVSNSFRVRCVSIS